MALTKNDIRLIGELFDERFDKKFDVKFDIKFAIQKEEILDAMDEKLFKYKSDLMNKLDKIAGEISTYREEQTLMSGRWRENTDRLEDIEKIHPGGVHPSVA